MQWTFPDLDPGVPYTVTVSAETTVGKGEPVSIVVFSVQQGKIDHRPCAQNCDVQNLFVKNTASADTVVRMCHTYFISIYIIYGLYIQSSPHVVVVIYI